MDNSKSLLFRLDAFEMWIYRRVLKISWTAKIINEEVLRRMGTGREIVHQFKMRRRKHRRPRGRQRTVWMTDLTTALAVEDQNK